MYFFCAEPYEMKTNEVQKVSEHFKKSFISVSHLETARIVRGRAPYFCTRSSWDLLLLWICSQEPTEGLVPDVFPPAFRDRPPGVFPPAFPAVPAISTG